MNSALEDLWRQIEAARPTGDELVARQAMTEITPRLLAAIDARGHRHLLVTLNPDDDAYKDAGSRGITVATKDLLLPGTGLGRYIDIACEDASGHSMLDLVASELGDRLREASNTPGEVVSRVLAKWRRFWGQVPREVLSREAQIGLFAELWFLTYWLIPAIGVTPAVQCWRGPHGARHDFERPGLSIEAKGTASTRGRIFTINGVRQLEPPESGRLLFFSLRLREEGGASNTLPMLIDTCRRRTTSDPDAEGQLETALIAAGYLIVHATEYAKTRWRVLEELLFEVQDDFPRIVSRTFTSGVPTGVEQLDYGVNLGAFDHLVVARRPGDASELLRQV
jgi:hypothetical protein